MTYNYNEFRNIDGSGNNSDQGKANNPLIRLLHPAFADHPDHIDEPRGGYFNVSTLPNPRTISNIVMDEDKPTTNFLNASDWLWQWGQFIDHDLDLNEAEPHPPDEDITPITVPDNDPIYPDGTKIPFTRVTPVEGTGSGYDAPREYHNQITAFMDASSVYGSDEERADFLRDTQSGKGLLKTSTGYNSEILLPLNDKYNPQPNATGGVPLLVEEQYVAGDVRANEQIGLNAVHALFVREHNRVALDLHKRLKAGDKTLRKKFRDFRYEFIDENPSASRADVKDEFLYQSARKVIGAKVQAISYNEFLPLLIGENSLEKYSGFDPHINPQISVEFANAAYRLGHTLLSDQLRHVDDNGITETALKDAFFTPGDVRKKGINHLLIGLGYQGAEELDHKLVDGVRNFLFFKGVGLDLASINIARGRDTGIPSYTYVYNKLFGYKDEDKITSFKNLGSQGLGLFDDHVVGLFEDAYESVDQIDLWLGGIAELPDDHGGLLGPTFSYFIKDQFSRLRDGDEFFYLNDLEHLKILDPDIEKTTLSEVIRADVTDPYLVPDDSFMVPFDNSIFGDDYKNIIKGNFLNDLIDGYGGNDKILGHGGDDIIFGGLGDDYIRGGSGADKILGGDGDDKLKGNSGRDYINGGAGNDYIRGGGGADKILGGYGHDKLKGNGGIDYIHGGDGNDYIYGGRGADTIRGGAGNDHIRGGSGTDTYVFGYELLDGHRNVDTIWGFQKIDSFDFNGYLGAGGKVELEWYGRGALRIDLSGEDVVKVFGSRRAIITAVNQLKALNA